MSHHAFELNLHGVHGGNLMLFHAMDDGFIKVAETVEAGLNVLEILCGC